MPLFRMPGSPTRAAVARVGVQVAVAFRFVASNTQALSIQHLRRRQTNSREISTCKIKELTVVK
jgi:hypothetical protein